MGMDHRVLDQGERNIKLAPAEKAQWWMTGGSNEITAPSIMRVILCNPSVIGGLADTAGD